MGQVADQLPVGPVLGHALLFSFDAKPLVDRPKLEQQCSRRQLDWRNDAVDVQGLLTRRHEDQVLISETALLANGLMQQACQGARVREKSRKGLVEDALAAGREQRLCRRVDVLHTERPVEEHHGGSEPVQPR